MDKELKKICAQVRQLAAEIRKNLLRAEHDTAPRVAALYMFYMFAKGFKSYQAADRLFRDGFWQDAAILGRTVLELGFQARWMNLDLEPRAALFIKHEPRDRRKLLRGLQASASPEIRSKATGALKDLEEALEGSEANDPWRNWWSEEGNIEKLARQMGLAPTYDLLYRPLCWFVHSSVFGNAYYLTRMAMK